MAKSRPQQTMADYMAIALSPALVIVLVGSLAFFLLTIFYAGEFEERMYWTTACFVFAAVLISRISIVEGAERASMFGLVLGLVAGLAMMRFTNHPWWAWIVLGVIWWCASHLVWNCTLIDDDDDASGEGLLEAAGFDMNVGGTADAQTAESPANASKFTTAAKRKRAAEQSAKPASPPEPWGKRVFAWWQRSASRKAPPGLTVVYFSLAALPIFGLGQHFVQPGDRRYAFNLTVRYVAAALGLLLTTSFLGLRRYLRQRRLEMPTEMAGIWLGVGAAMAATILLLAILIPRPNPEYALSSLTGTLSSPERQANSRAVMHDSPGQGNSQSTAAANDQTQVKPPDAQQAAQNSEAQQPGRSQDGGQQQGSTGGTPSGTSPSGQQTTPGGGSSSGQSQGSSGQRTDGQADQQQQGRGEQSLQQSGEEQNQQGSQSQSTSQQQGDNAAQQSDANQSGDQQPDKQSQSGSNTEDKQENSQTGTQNGPPQQQSAQQAARAMSQHAQQPPTPRSPFSLGETIARNFKLLLYVVAILVGLYCLVRYWSQVKAFLAALWREIVDLLNSIFGRHRRSERAAADVVQEEKRIALRPFASFADPFASGAARNHPPAAVVQYSFEALEAWVAERGLAREGDETPLEFSARVAAEHPPLAEGVQVLASLYARVAYARQSLRGESLGDVEQLWKALRGAPQPVAIDGGRR